MGVGARQKPDEGRKAYLASLAYGTVRSGGEDSAAGV